MYDIGEYESTYRHVHRPPKQRIDRANMTSGSLVHPLLKIPIKIRVVLGESASCEDIVLVILEAEG